MVTSASSGAAVLPDFVKSLISCFSHLLHKKAPTLFWLHSVAVILFLSLNLVIKWRIVGPPSAATIMLPKAWSPLWTCKSTITISSHPRSKGWEPAGKAFEVVTKARYATAHTSAPFWALRVAAQMRMPSTFSVSAALEVMDRISEESEASGNFPVRMSSDAWRKWLLAQSSPQTRSRPFIQKSHCCWFVVLRFMVQYLGKLSFNSFQKNFKSILILSRHSSPGTLSGIWNGNCFLKPAWRIDLQKSISSSNGSTSESSRGRLAITASTMHWLTPAQTESERSESNPKTAGLKTIPRNKNQNHCQHQLKHLESGRH